SSDRCRLSIWRCTAPTRVASGKRNPGDAIPYGCSCRRTSPLTVMVRLLWRCSIQKKLRSRRLHVELDVDIVADQQAAGLECSIPGETEILAVQSNCRFEGDLLVAPRILGHTKIGHRQFHTLGNSSYCQHPADGERVGPRSDDAIAREGDLRILVDGEEVIGP